MTDTVPIESYEFQLGKYLAWWAIQHGWFDHKPQVPAQPATPEQNLTEE